VVADRRAGPDQRIQAQADDSPRSRQLLRLTDPGADTSTGRAPGDGDPVVAHAGHQWRLRPDGSLQRWDVTAQSWTSLRREQWSEEDVTYLTDVEAARTRIAELARAEEEPALIRPGSTSLAGCTCLGGDLPSLCVYGKYVLAVRRDALELRSRQAGTTIISFEDLVDVRIGGRGRLDVDLPGGESFGLAGVHEGMAAAAVVRSLVERTRMETSITVETKGGDAVFHCARLEPDQVRTIVAPLATRLRRRATSDGRGGRVDPTRDLVHLADLKERGLLTEQEFASAVAAALDGTL
jgi:hypothetical protein